MGLEELRVPPLALKTTSRRLASRQLEGVSWSLCSQWHTHSNKATHPDSAISWAKHIQTITIDFQFFFLRNCHSDFHSDYQSSLQTAINKCLSQGFYSCTNLRTKKQVGEERVYSAYTSILLFITKEARTGTQAGQEAGADAEAMEGCSLLACLTWLAQPALL